MKIHILTSHFYFQLKELEEKKQHEQLQNLANQVVRTASREVRRDQKKIEKYVSERLPKLDPPEDRIIFGGAERYMVELCKLLTDLGHEVTVVQGHSGTGMIRREYEGIEILSFGYPNNDYGELNRIFHEYAVYADLRIIFAPFLAWPIVRQPAIVISHGIFWDFPTHFIRSADEPTRREFFRRQQYAMTTCPVVAVDTNVRNFWAAYDPGSEQQIHVIPNFVDTDEFTPKTERTWERPRLLCPRRLTAIRGVNEFIAAAGMFPDADFIVCGSGLVSEMEERLAKFAEDKPNLYSVWHEMGEMAPVYREADIAVIPTRAAEGTSLSMAEAMATGLPVITTPVGGLANMVIDGYNGVVVDLNHEDLTRAIRFLLDNPSLWKVYGERNRQIAVDAFSLKLWRERWTRFLEKVT